MTSETTVFQNKKALFNFAILFLFFVCLLTSLFNCKPNMIILLSKEGVKEIGVTKSKVFEEFVMTLLASTRVFHKKCKLVFF